jgi:uncharacterized protein
VIVSESVGELVVDGQTRSIVLNDAARRFEVVIDGHLAVIAFRREGSVLSLNHTEVPASLRGKGLADAMARAALEYARGRHLTVNPYCPFVAKFIERHLEYQPLVDPGFTRN